MRCDEHPDQLDGIMSEVTAALNQHEIDFNGELEKCEDLQSATAPGATLSLAFEGMLAGVSKLDEKFHLDVTLWTFRIDHDI